MSETQGSVSSLPADGSVAPIQRFLPIRRLGEGATGQVTEVEDKVHGGRFALKRLRREGISPDRMTRFKDEFRALERISHPNLVKIHELVHDEAGISVLMELVDGIDLLRYVRPSSGSTRGQPAATRSSRTGEEGGARPIQISSFDLSLDRLRATLPQLVRGLSALHAIGKVHCDIKPENILVTAEGRLVIVDFGLITATETGGGTRGTPSFMAPEQFGGTISEAVDWYAVGVLLYCALSGRLPIPSPFQPNEHAKNFSRVIDPRIQSTGLPDDLVNLALRLLNSDPNARPKGHEVARELGILTVIPHRARTEFVGREAELRQLGSAFDETRTAGAQVVHVHGESGIGKTALVQRFAATIEDSGAVVFRGNCYMDASVPYKGLDSLVDHIATSLARRAIPLEEHDRSALARLFPVFGLRFPVFGLRLHAEVLPEHDEDPAVLRGRAVRSFQSLLVNLAKSDPITLWIDDLQWTDKESVDFLSDVLRSPSPTRVLLLLGYRSTAMGGGKRVQYARDCLPRHRDLELGPLDNQALREIVQRRGAIDPHKIEAVVRESQGNPFFGGELLRALTAGYRGETLSLESVLSSRVGALHSTHRAYLELVAVAGRPLDEGLLGRALQVSRTASLEARSVLVASSFLRLAENDSHTVEAYHDRIREHLLRHLSPASAKAHHAALAEAYSATGLEDTELLALHYRASGNSAKAILYTERAADSAAQALAFNHAAGLYDAALSIADGAARVSLHIKHARALSNAGRPAEAAQAFMSAIEHRPDDLDLLLAAGEEFLRAGQIDGGLSILRRASSTFQEPIPKNTVVAIVSLLWNGFRLHRAQPRVVEDRDILPKDRQKLALCFTIARQLAMVDTLRGALFQRRYAILALQSGIRADIVQGLALEVTTSAFVAGGIAPAEKMLSLAKSLATESDAAFTKGVLPFAHGMLEFAKGRWSSSQIALEEAATIFRDKSAIGTHWEVMISQSFILLMLWLKGDVLEARQRLQSYLLDATGSLAMEALIRLRVGVMIALCDDCPEEARIVATNTIASWPSSPWRLHHYFEAIAQAEIDLYEGATRGSLQRLQRSWDKSRKAGFFHARYFFLTSLVVRARINLALGRTSEATVDLQKIRKLERPEERWAVSIGKALNSCLLVAQGNREAAVQVMSEAVVSLQDSELSLYAIAAQYRHSQLKLDVNCQNQALAELASRSVRSPERLINSLLPWSLDVDATPQR